MDLRLFFAFTYIPRFFAKQGFAEIERGELPAEGLEGPVCGARVPVLR